MHVIYIDPFVPIISFLLCDLLNFLGKTRPIPSRVNYKNLQSIGAGSRIQIRATEKYIFYIVQHCQILEIFMYFWPVLDSVVAQYGEPITFLPSKKHCALLG